MLHAWVLQNIIIQKMASRILCHALITNLITPLHHSGIQKRQFVFIRVDKTICVVLLDCHY